MKKTITNALVDVVMIAILGAAMIFLLSTSCERDRERECDRHNNELPWCGGEE